jgi:hypothetical protein
LNFGFAPPADIRWLTSEKAGFGPFAEITRRRDRCAKTCMLERQHPLHAHLTCEYRGAPGDLPQGKFGYIKDGNEDMGDALNFRDYRGRCFGYAPHHMIDLRPLGAPPGFRPLRRDSCNLDCYEPRREWPLRCRLVQERPDLRGDAGAAPGQCPPRHCRRGGRCRQPSRAVGRTDVLHT